MTGIPKALIMSISILIVLGNCSTIDKAQTIFDETRRGIEENAQVYEEDALKALIIARNFNLVNQDVHDRSVAQIVFPKAVKGSFIFGGNYAEGYLIENEQVIAQIRMLGGNIGPNIGGQSYSQITYVMDQETLFEIKNGQKFSLQGTASYAKVRAKCNRNIWSNIRRAKFDNCYLQPVRLPCREFLLKVHTFQRRSDQLLQPSSFRI
jgi:hypothetical protein